MSINTDGPKKQGKFLKKNSKILSRVQMTPFSFTDIVAETNTVEFDNLSRSIIHSKFHSESELAAKIREHAAMSERVHDAAHPNMSVIMPADFTADWHNERMNSKRRALGFDDDDDYDFPTASPSEPVNSTKEPMVETSTATKTLSAQPANLTAVVATSEHELVADQIAEKAKVISIVEEPYAKHESREEADFIPLSTSASDQATSVEDLATAAYRQRAELEQLHAETLAELKEAAKAEGYKEGFRLGEEKGVVSARASATEVFSRAAALIHEFEGLKKNVLDNIQKNFFELSQAVAESLLDREFSIQPEAFAKVLEKVIADTVTNDEFKVRLHPESWQKVMDLNIESLSPHLIKDPSIPVGEFKIESQLTVVDGNTKKIVSQMLQNVDMSLFENTKVAS